jgi:hypothetical protein
MEFIGIFFSLFFAIMLTAIFSLAFRNTGPWRGFWVFFILLFFVALGAGEWAAPRGPAAWGYYWVPGLLAAVILSLILAAAAPSSPRKLRRTATGPEEDLPGETAATLAVIGVFFWCLIFVLLAVVISGLLN